MHHKNGTTHTATLVSIHGILDAENHEQMEVHQKIAEMKLNVIN